MSEFIKNVNKVIRMRGRIISDKNGIQAIMTDSKEEGKKYIHCLGFSRIEDATEGDYVELTYVCVVTWNSNKTSAHPDRKREFDVAGEANGFCHRLLEKNYAASMYTYWKGRRL